MAGTTARKALTALAVEPGSALETALAGKVAVGTTYSRTGGLLIGFGTAAGVDTGTASGQIGLLGTGGKFPQSFIPTTAITTVTSVASQAAMLALTDSVGQVAKRTDQGLSYWQTASPASTLGNWTTVTDVGVTSVNTQAGVVSLTTANIPENALFLYYTTARVNTDAPNVTLNAAVDTVFGLTGQQLTFDTQAAKTLLVGPASGSAAVPTFRLLVAGDLPSHPHVLADVTDAQAALDLKADLTTTGLTNYTTSTVLTSLLAGKGNLAAGNSWTGAQTFGVTAGNPVTFSGTTGSAVIDSTGQVSATLFSGVFSGSGASLTGLAAGNLATGTVPVARIPTAIPAASIGTGTVDNTEFGYLDGVTSAIQTQLDTKAPLTRLGQVNAGTITTNYTPDASAGGVFNVTLGAAPVTMNAPTNPTDGQTIKFKLRQDGTGNRTVTWNAIYSFGTDITAAPTLSTAASKVDVVGFIYDATATKWWCVAQARGY